MASFLKSLARGASRGMDHVIRARLLQEQRAREDERLRTAQKRHEQEQASQRLQTMLGVLNADIARVDNQIREYAKTPGVTANDLAPFQVQRDALRQRRDRLLAENDMALPGVDMTPAPRSTKTAEPGASNEAQASTTDTATSRILGLRQADYLRRAINQHKARAAILAEKDPDAAMRHIEAGIGLPLPEEEKENLNNLFQGIRAETFRRESQKAMEQLANDLSDFRRMAAERGGEEAYRQFMAQARFVSEYAGMDPGQVQALGQSLLLINPLYEPTPTQANELSQREVQMAMVDNALEKMVTADGSLRPDVADKFGVVAGRWTDLKRVLDGGELTPEVQDAWWALNFLTEKMGRSLTGAAIQDWERDFFERLFGSTKMSPETAVSSLRNFKQQLKREQDAIWRSIKKTKDTSLGRDEQKDEYETDMNISPDDLFGGEDE